MTTYDPLAVRLVLGPGWIISNPDEDFDPTTFNPIKGTDPPKALDPATDPEYETDGPSELVRPAVPVPPRHPLLYRTVFTVGRQEGFVGVVCFGLGILFAVLPTTGVTVFLSGLFFFSVFACFITVGCCCGPYSSYTEVHNHGMPNAYMPPYVASGGPPFAPTVIVPDRAC